MGAKKSKGSWSGAVVQLRQLMLYIWRVFLLEGQRWWSGKD